MNIEELKKLLEEKIEQRNQIEKAFDQVTGMIILLKQLIEKTEKELKKPENA